jgi:transcription elongation factor Elf1
MTKKTFPMAIAEMINSMTKCGWVPVMQEKVRRARTFICPKCNAWHLEQGRGETLSRRAAKNILLFEKQDKAVAMCHVCGFRKVKGEAVSTGPATPTPSTNKLSCQRCGKELTGRQRKWCSVECRKGKNPKQEVAPDPEMEAQARNAEAELEAGDQPW